MLKLAKSCIRQIATIRFRVRCAKFQYRPCFFSRGFVEQLQNQGLDILTTCFITEDTKMGDPSLGKSKMCDFTNSCRGWLNKVIQIFRGIRHSEIFYDRFKKAWVLSSYVTHGNFKETLQLSMATQQSFRNVLVPILHAKRNLSVSLPCQYY